MAFVVVVDMKGEGGIYANNCVRADARAAIIVIIIDWRRQRESTTHTAVGGSHNWFY